MCLRTDEQNMVSSQGVYSEWLDGFYYLTHARMAWRDSIPRVMESLNAYTERVSKSVRSVSYKACDKYNLKGNQFLNLYRIVLWVHLIRNKSTINI